MAREQQRFSNRDEIYLISTSFEVYMITGVVFLILFTAGFLLGHMIGFAWLVWPGSFIAVLAAYFTLKRLEQREQAIKRTALENEYREQAK
jgi:hypothetical protein